MQFVTIEQVRVHCKTEESQDDDITPYVDRAEDSCVAYCNRTIFKDVSDYENAMQQLPDDAQGQYNSYQAALAAAELETEEVKKATMIEVANEAYRLALNKQASIKRAMIATPGFQAAVLFMTANLWRNREDVAAGQGASATELPMNSKFHLAPFFYAGGN